VISAQLISDELQSETKPWTQTWAVGDIRVAAEYHGEQATLYTFGDSRQEHEAWVDALETIAQTLGVWIRRSFGIDMTAIIVRADSIVQILDALAAQQERSTQPPTRQ
jgi:hypothetical protein